MGMWYEGNKLTDSPELLVRQSFAWLLVGQPICEAQLSYDEPRNVGAKI
jgi:hypothetical protein